LLRHAPSNLRLHVSHSLTVLALAISGLGAAPPARPLPSTRPAAAPLSPNTVLSVTKTDDTADGACDADCSLREAVIAANTAAGADILSVPAGVYTLTIAGASENLAATGDLDILDDLELVGDGAALSVIDADQLDRVFHIHTGVIATIAGVRLQHGAVETTGTGEAASGGGLYSDGSLTITASVIQENLAGLGGGVFNNTGAFQIYDSHVLSNTADEGGGLYLFGPGQLISATTIAGNTSEDGAGVYAVAALSMFSSTLTTNSADRHGGGLFAIGEVSIVSSAATSNTAGAFGGGLYNQAWLSLEGGEITSNEANVGGGIYNNRLLAITGTVFTANKATLLGGGLATNHQVLEGNDPDPIWYVATINQATFAGNSAMDGGGVFADSTLTVTESTFITNTASQSGGGLFRYDQTPHTVLISATQFISNTAFEGGGLANGSGPLDLQSSQFISNFAAAGGGLFNGDDDGAPVPTTPNLTVTASRFEANSSYAGGALANSPGAYLRLEASDVVSNTSPVAAGLWNRGHLTIPGSTIAYNQAPLGGAGIVNTGTLTMTNSLLAFNVSGGEAGGVWNEAGGGPSLIEDSQILSNTGTAGGGIYAHSGELRIESTEISANTVVTAGGGIFNLGQLTVVDSDLLGNTAGETGGALYNGIYDTSTLGITATAEISQSLVSGNSAGVYGGGLHNAWDSLLTVLDSEIMTNTATTGGGVTNQGTLALQDTLVSHNQASFNGGGIANGSRMAITRAMIADNQAEEYAGGIFAGGAWVGIIRDSTIIFNSAPLGAGVYADYNGVIITSTTIFSNTASMDGGGVYANASVTMTNATVSSNSAMGAGGGIYQTDLAGIVTRLNNVTIANNTADADDDGTGDAGGVYVNGGILTTSNSIMAGNVDPGGEAPDCSGTVNSAGYNLIETAAGCTLAAAAPGDLTGAPALLGPLADNGGPTWTHTLLPDSPAVNAGNPAAPESEPAACTATDQRGVARAQAGRCDVGAYESDLDNPPTVQFSSAAYTATETAGSAVFTVTLSAASGLTVTVDYSTTAGSAMPGVDYVSAAGTLTFTAGVQTLTATVTLLEDSRFEGPEMFDLSLTLPARAVFGTPATAPVTLLSDDPYQVYLPVIQGGGQLGVGVTGRFAAPHGGRTGGFYLSRGFR
jgi:CSLREA domain-containing protein